ncbi:MAG TPA: RodZ domain-containing protein [Blastocatellia bacterium]|nr:RodZ domain-containing protein [Blastocatellia bacterium]
MNGQRETLTLGQELKRRREARGIDLQEIANVTRVSARFLRAIEEDDFNALPGGLFTRSFIRTYARYVGMDEEQAISRYYEQIGQPRDEPARLSLAAEGERRKKISILAATAITLSVLVVLGLGGWAGWNYWQRRHVRPAPSVLSEPTPGKTSQQTTSPEQHLPSSDVSAAPSPATAPALTSGPAPRPLEVRLEASEECWISYVADDETKPVQFILKPQEVRTITAQSQIKLSVGKVTALRMLINGQPAELPAVGLVARDVVITPENAAQYIKR